MADARATGAALKDKVEAEAEAAETETPETEPVEQPPADPTPEEDEAEEQDEQPAEPEQKGGRQKDPRKEFDKAFTAFGKKLAAIFESDDLVPAPHPGVVGYMLPGFVEPRTHDSFRRCDTCNGLGKVLTGANTGDETKDWHPCPDGRCKGRGYWQKSSSVEERPATGPLAVVAEPMANGEYAEAPAWMGDPNLSPATG